MIKKPKLNYRIHNPNSSEETAEYIYKLFLQAGRNKLDEIIMEAASDKSIDDKISLSE